MASKTLASAPNVNYKLPSLIKTKEGTLEPTSTSVIFGQTQAQVQALTSTAAAPAASDLTLTTAWQQVPGTDVEIPEPGTYLVTGIVDFDMTVAGTTNAKAQLTVGGVAEANVATVSFSAVSRNQGVQSWVITTDAQDVTIQLEAQKDAAAGTIAARGTNSILTVVRQG